MGARKMTNNTPQTKLQQDVSEKLEKAECLAPFSVGDTVKCIHIPKQPPKVVQGIDCSHYGWWWLKFDLDSPNCRYPAKWYILSQQTVLEEVQEIEKAS